MSTSSPKPELSLGTPPPRLRSTTGPTPRAWLFFMVVLQLAIVVILLFKSVDRTESLSSTSVGATATPLASTRPVAIALENRSLHAQAADAWLEYLRATPQAEDRAEVMYRVGQQYEQAERFEQAAAAYIRCEQASSEDSAFRQKVGPRIVYCLRQLGLYGEVGRELSRRVESGAEKTEKGKLLASIGGEKITDADLDRLIERQVDQVLAMQGAAASPEIREQFLREFSRPEARRQAFDELIRTELFTRRARDLKLDQDESYLAARRSLENSLLANRFVEQELGKIHPTEVDIESFYKSQESRYREPESVAVRIEELRSDDELGKVLEQIQSAEDFRRWQQKRHERGAPTSDVAPTETVIRGKLHSRLGQPNSLFELAEGQWTREPIVHESRKFLVLVEQKSPAHTPPLDQIRNRVQDDYVSRKRQEMSQSLLQDLIHRYNVKLEPWDSNSGQATK